MPSAKPTSDDVLKTAKDRLKAIDQELSGYDALIAERDRLQKAIAALDPSSKPARQQGSSNSDEPPKRTNRKQSDIEPEIRHYLESEGAATTAKLVEETGAARNTVTNALKALKAKRRDGDGLWELGK